MRFIMVDSLCSFLEMDALSELRVAPPLAAELELQSCTPELLRFYTSATLEQKESLLGTDTFYLRRRTIGAAG
jgi:hypothetical protein